MPEHHHFKKFILNCLIRPLYIKLIILKIILKFLRDMKLSNMDNSVYAKEFLKIFKN